MGNLKSQASEAIPAEPVECGFAINQLLNSHIPANPGQPIPQPPPPPTIPPLRPPYAPRLAGPGTVTKIRQTCKGQGGRQCGVLGRIWEPFGLHFGSIFDASSETL